MVNNWYYLFKHLVVVFMVMLILLVLEIKRGNRLYNCYHNKYQHEH